MSELTLFQENNLALPDYLRDSLDEATTNLMGFSSIKRISIRNGAFHLVSGGKEVFTSEENALQVIIVRTAEKTSRTYYEGAYTEGSNAAPDCWSNDGEKPEANCPNKQANACATCRQNEVGSGSREDSRACRFNRRIAVVLADQIDSGDIYQMIIPATSLFGEGDKGKMSLQQYARLLGSNHVGFGAVITEMRFDRSAQSTKLAFRAVRYLTQPEYAKVKELADHPTAIAAMAYEPPAIKPGQDTVVKTDVIPPGVPSTARPRPAPVRPKPEPKENLIEEPEAVRTAEDMAEELIAKRPVPVEPVEEVVEEPVVRKAKEAPAPRPASAIASILDEWGTDDED